MNKKAAVFWCLTLIIMATIFYFSSQTAVESTVVSMGFSERILRALLSITNMTETEISAAVKAMDGPVRALAHYSIFASLGTTCYLAVYFTKNMKNVYSVGICTAYALFDEIHQIFVPGRSFQVSDILTDTAGVITGTLIVIMILAYIKNRQNKGRKNYGKKL